MRGERGETVGPGEREGTEGQEGNTAVRQGKQRAEREVMVVAMVVGVDRVIGRRCVAGSGTRDAGKREPEPWAEAARVRESGGRERIPRSSRSTSRRQHCGPRVSQFVSDRLRAFVSTLVDLPSSSSRG